MKELNEKGKVELELKLRELCNDEVDLEFYAWIEEVTCLEDLASQGLIPIIELSGVWTKSGKIERVQLDHDCFSDIQPGEERLFSIVVSAIKGGL